MYHLEICEINTLLVQAWTNEWWVGRIAPGLDHFDTTAFTPIEGAHGVLDYGGVYAAKTGADTAIDQRKSTRRVMFSSTGWQRKGVPGCEPQQTMPRELTLSTPAEALRHGEGGAPFLWIEPAKELTTLRTTVAPKFRAIAGTPDAMISGAGAQIEVAVSCSGIKTTETEMSLTLTVLRSKDGREGVRVSYWQTNSTLQVDHRLANMHSPSSLVQNAPVPSAIVSTNDMQTHRVDGGYHDEQFWIISEREHVRACLEVAGHCLVTPLVGAELTQRGCHVLQVAG
eukprot:COSAG02_NODE_11115_length_1790_cov_1.460674_2_plen_284_part_00